VKLIKRRSDTYSHQHIASKNIIDKDLQALFIASLEIATYEKQVMR